MYVYACMYNNTIIYFNIMLTIVKATIQTVNYWVFLPLAALDHQQSKPELKELVRYSRKIARVWKQLALELSLSAGDVDVIDINHDDVNDKCYEMFNTWLRQTCDPCWCQVANALKIVKLNEVAIAVENKLGKQVNSC